MATEAMSAKPIRLAIIGVGKIARDQHLPAIANDPRFELVAAVSRNAVVDGVDNYHDIAELLAAGHDLDAVSICTPPVGRSAIAMAALDAGLDVMMEKPPAATLSEVARIEAHAIAAGRSLFATWHSREAAGVAPARAWLADRTVERVTIAWREDIRRWHPGQDWILEPGGMGVFDPGINALSIVTHLLPRPFALRKATLHTPSNRQAPLAATLTFADTDNVPVTAEFDFLQTGHQCWDIAVETTQGTLMLSEGGAKLHIDGVAHSVPAASEYDGLYARFVQLVRAGESEVDTTPFVHVADVFLLGERQVTAPFAW